MSRATTRTADRATRSEAGSGTNLVPLLSLLLLSALLTRLWAAVENCIGGQQAQSLSDHAHARAGRGRRCRTRFQNARRATTSRRPK